MSPNTAILIVALYLAVGQNRSYLDAVTASLPQPFTWQEWRIALSAGLAMLGVITLEIAALAFGRLLKPTLVFFILAAAVSSYFMDNFGIVIDDLMIVNVAKTDVREAGDLLRLDFFLHLLTTGILPAWLLGRCPIQKTRWTEDLVKRL